MHLLVCFNAYLILVIVRLYIGLDLQLSSAQSLLTPSDPSVSHSGYSTGQSEITRLERALQLKYFGPGFTIDLPHKHDHIRTLRDLAEAQAAPILGENIILRRKRSDQARPKPLSILMNFGLDGVSKWSDTDDEWQEDCPLGFIFDPSTQICRQAVCVPITGHDHVNETCITHQAKRTIRIPANATEAKIFVSLGLHNDTDINVLRNLRCCIERDIEENMRHRLIKFLKIHEHQIANVTVPNFVTYYKEHRRPEGGLPTDSHIVDEMGVMNITRVEATFVLRRAAEYRNRSDSIVEMYDKLASAVVGRKSPLFSVDNVVIEIFGIWEEASAGEIEVDIAEAQSWCKQGTVEIYCNTDFTLNLNSTKSTLFLHTKARNRTYECGQFKVQVFVKNLDGQPYLTQVAMICEMSDTFTCPDNAGMFYAEGAKLFRNSTLKYNGDLYDISQYKHDKISNQFLLCGTKKMIKRTRPNAVMGFNMRNELSYLSTCLSVLSIIALILTLIVYGLFRDLRTLPGLNLINVMVALIVAQTALLMNSAFSEAGICRAIGIITHYAYLLGFFFANVIAFDIYQKFGKGRSGTFGTDDRQAVRIRLLKNMAYCYLSAGVIVGSAVILDEHHVKGWEVQYQELCWIAGERASLIFFAAPIILLNIVNAGLVCVTLYRIRRHKQSMRGLRVNAKTGVRDGSKREVMSYVRIGTVFGFTWIFGIVSGLVKGQAAVDDATYVVYEVLIYIFILTQSCQGVLIFLAFGINANVRRKLVSLYRRHFIKECKTCGAKVCRCVDCSTITTSTSANSFD